MAEQMRGQVRGPWKNMQGGSPRSSAITGGVFHHEQPVQREWWPVHPGDLVVGGDKPLIVPVALVHPSLELAALDKDPADRWAVSTLPMYTAVGPEPIGEARIDREVPDSHATLNGEEPPRLGT